jgi:hypothetical protein
MAANGPAATTPVCPNCGRPGGDAPSHQLEARIATLEAENVRLSEAAKRFGELAERLNEQLREERRHTQERRPRDQRDRRGFGAPND